MTARPPVLDTRDAAAVLAGMLARRPGYLPGWRPQPGEPAHALLAAVAHLTGLAIERLNRVPERDLLAFLDGCGIDLAPPQAARAAVVFTLAPDTPVDVALPEDTELA